MQNSVWYYLEKTAEKFPNKVAVKDCVSSLTYAQFLSQAISLGNALKQLNIKKSAVCVYMPKCCEAVLSFFAVAYAGGFYSVLNTELPDARLKQAVATLKPSVIITTDDLKKKATDLFPQHAVKKISQLQNLNNTENLPERVIDTDILYINFTSGSTGTPKGIAVSHRSVIDFIDCFTETFDITDKDIVANQAPFDFDVSVKDIYSAISTGATLVIVPRELFSAPAKLADFLCEQKVTTMIWAVSALCLMSTFHTLDYKTPKTVNKILFSGEVMPQKALLDFRKHLPDALYVNLYGPTEITCNCTYHILDNNCNYSDGIPIGKPFFNEDVFLISDDNKLITEQNVIGEICVRGTALAMGYYSSSSQTKEHFIQNPLNPNYPEIIYKTGDNGKYNKNGDLMFCGRKDFQIKYMGHRIELEEIERETLKTDGVDCCCCVFDQKRSRLICYYIGNIEKGELHKKLKCNLPAFMVPGIIRKTDSMPLTKNGKIDRSALLNFKNREVRR